MYPCNWFFVLASSPILLMVCKEKKNPKERWTWRRRQGMRNEQKKPMERKEREKKMGEKNNKADWCLDGRRGGKGTQWWIIRRDGREQTVEKTRDETMNLCLRKEGRKKKKKSRWKCTVVTRHFITSRFLWCAVSSVTSVFFFLFFSFLLHCLLFRYAFFFLHWWLPSVIRLCLTLHLLLLRRVPFCYVFFFFLTPFYLYDCWLYWPIRITLCVCAEGRKEGSCRGLRRALCVPP